MLLEKLLEILNIAGYISTIFVIVLFVWGVIMWIRGIFPALLRLGNGLAKRKIVIFAKDDNFQSLKSLLTGSKLFKEKNICGITNIKDIGLCEDTTVYLVFWHDWEDNIDRILEKKPNESALIIYAPRDLGFIPEEDMKKIDGHRNTIVANLRGRLLNDVVSSLITTSYDRE